MKDYLITPVWAAGMDAQSSGSIFLEAWCLNLPSETEKEKERLSIIHSVQIISLFLSFR